MALIALAAKAVRDAAALARAAAGDRRVRRGAVLRRRGADAGDLGAVGGRGAGGRHRRRSSPTSCRSRSACWSALFALQTHGTAAVGTLFGPVTLLWFLAIGAAGAVRHRARARRSSRRSTRCTRCASSPRHGVASFVVLGSVVLAVTGAEALYADMGHFGKRAVRIAWFSLVAPALVLNYFGQGALLMARARGGGEPVLPRCCPAWALYPMVALATAATRDRLAGDDLRRLLDHAAGDPARLPAAHDHRPHLGAARSGQIYMPGGQLDAAAPRWSPR